MNCEITGSSFSVSWCGSLSLSLPRVSLKTAILQFLICQIFEDTLVHNYIVKVVKKQQQPRTKKTCQINRLSFSHLMKRKNENREDRPCIHIRIPGQLSDSTKSKTIWMECLLKGKREIVHANHFLFHLLFYRRHLRCDCCWCCCWSRFSVSVLFYWASCIVLNSLMLLGQAFSRVRQTDLSRTILFIKQFFVVGTQSYAISSLFHVCFLNPLDPTIIFWRGLPVDIDLVLIYWKRLIYARCSRTIKLNEIFMKRVQHSPQSTHSMNKTRTFKKKTRVKKTSERNTPSGQCVARKWFQ